MVRHFKFTFSFKIFIPVNKAYVRVIEALHVIYKFTEGDTDFNNIQYSSVELAFCRSLVWDGRPE